jgi:hypothetical protein
VLKFLELPAILQLLNTAQAILRKRKIFQGVINKE